MAEDEKRETPEAGRRDEMSEAEIDRNLLETFPASDPPSWTLGMDHRRPSTAAEPPAGDEGE
ncbi:MAG TPA: hypothetical protein VN228_05235 [Pyrinomonadaceae bacterium]|nr:hypothetical protein [Pyrinomonadaceae bacterium]